MTENKAMFLTGKMSFVNQGRSIGDKHKREGVFLSRGAHVHCLVL